MDKKNKATYIIDPIDFLNYIYNAELVITDSFHATSFSIIFNKKFWVLNRNENLKMFSRITSLLKIGNLMNRITDKYLTNVDINQKINYEIINEELTKLKNESLKYLQQAIN